MRPWITRRSSETSSSSCSSCPITSRELVVRDHAQVGHRLDLVLGRQRPRALEDRTIEVLHRLGGRGQRSSPVLDLGLDAHHALRAQDVDPTVEEATALRDRVLLALELREHAVELGVGQGRQIREQFHVLPFGRLPD